jgi:hypothetical protein
MGPAALLTAASAVKAGSSIMSGYGRASEMKAQARNAEAKARAVKLQGVQDSASRYEELDSAMQTIQALRGARNVGLDSPTAIAIDRQVQRQATEGLLKSQLGFSQEVDAQNRSAAGLRRGSRLAIISGFMDAAPSAFDAFGAMNSPKPKGK